MGQSISLCYNERERLMWRKREVGEEVKLDGRTRQSIFLGYVWERVMWRKREEAGWKDYPKHLSLFQRLCEGVVEEK